MAIRTSREQFKNPRWGIEAASETPDADCVEPPSQQRDHGWEPGVDVPVAEWWNWQWLQTYLFLAYIESVWAGRWDQNHVIRDQKGTSAGNVTAGVGLSVNVAAARVWIAGAQYACPASTNLALDTADPTDPRLDLVVADLTSNVISYQVITGTPDPAPVSPAVGANQVAMKNVLVLPAGVAPDSFIERRRYGILELDRLDSDVVLRAGDLGGGDWLLEVDADTQVVDIGGGKLVIDRNEGASGEATLDVSTFTIPPEAVTFDAPITRKADISAMGFVPDPNNTPQVNTEGTLGGSDGHFARAAVQIPNGATITAFRVYGHKDNTNKFLDCFLYRSPKGGSAGTPAKVELANDDNSGGATGMFTVEVTGLSHTVTQASLYWIEVQFQDGGAGGTLDLVGAEVEYEETKPFDGI